MITKLLVTIVVVLVGLTWARHRGMARQSGQAASRETEKPDNRLLVAVILVAIIAVGGVGFWLKWEEQHRQYTVRVIDTRSGNVQTYQVYQDDVTGRSFTTIDGRRVNLADVERMELVETPN